MGRMASADGGRTIETLGHPNLSLNKQTAHDKNGEIIILSKCEWMATQELKPPLTTLSFVANYCGDSDNWLPLSPIILK